MHDSDRTPVQLAIVMACHNRRDKTLACLASVGAQRQPGLAIDVYLLDDGSTDGTADAVRARFPDTHIMTGDGTLFWAGGMRIAFAAAMQAAPDFYLWLNDDLELRDGAIAALLEAHAAVARPGAARNIVVGAVTNRGMRTAIYGGIDRRQGWNRVRFQTHTPIETEPAECAAMSGNVVLISAAVARETGNIDPAFRHLLGDLDYGLRTRARGGKVWVAPGIAAYLTAQDAGKRIYNPDIGWRERWRLQRSPFGLQFGPWWTFCVRHGGAMAFFSFLWPYWRLVFPSSVQRAIGRLRAAAVPAGSRSGSGAP